MQRNPSGRSARTTLPHRGDGNKHNSFTLIKLLVVVTAITILANLLNLTPSAIAQEEASGSLFAAAPGEVIPFALQVILLLAVLVGCAVGWMQRRKGAPWGTPLLVASGALGIVLAVIGLTSGVEGHEAKDMALSMSDALGHGLAARLAEDVPGGGQILVLVPAATPGLEAKRRDALFGALRDGLANSSLRVTDGLGTKQVNGLPLSTMALSESGVSGEMLSGWAAEHGDLAAIVADLPSLDPQQVEKQVDALLPPLYVVVSGSDAERWAPLVTSGKAGGVLVSRFASSAPPPEQDMSQADMFDHFFRWVPGGAPAE